MFEKVNPSHPDKLCDRIAGAIVDEVYSLEDNPRIAIEVLLGHRRCSIILESSVLIPMKMVYAIVKRIAGDCEVDCREYAQDSHLADNQANGFHCGA